MFLWNSILMDLCYKLMDIYYNITIYWLPISKAIDSSGRTEYLKYLW